MRTVNPNRLFCWTLRGKPYLMLSAGSAALLILLIGVNVL